MAAALVGGAFLSATLQVLFERTTSPGVMKFIRARKVLATLLAKLEILFLSVKGVLNDAEERESTDIIVKQWLDELKNTVYDAEDLLDEIATEALRRQVEADFGTSTSKVRNFISTSFDQFGRKLESKIQKVVDGLESLVLHKNAIGLREGVEGRSSQRVPTTSLVDPETIIYGRDDDEKAIVNLLLSNDVASNNHSTGVISIVGMGGVGKTTLARQIYNNQKIIEHFSLKAWVCVSEEFDVPKITRKILEAVSPQKHGHTDFNKIPTELKNSLMGKKFLLILDDVWNENYDAWALLSIPFKYGTSGSRIIVTTRKVSVAAIMRPIQIFNLDKLSEEDCWLLFANHAFEKGKSNAYPELKRIGEEIIKKCDGLPLSAKALGCLLHSITDVEDWNKILKSKIWSLPNNGTDILPALRISYNYLPSHLKRCFAYLSISPKNYLFTKEGLVQLWMGEGFLQQHKKNEEMEVIGAEYFDDLVSRLLLQRSNESKWHFLMHDLVHDLAISVSGKFCFSLEGDNTNKIIDKTRHFSYLRTLYDTSEKFNALYKAKNLRTFVSLEMKKEDEDEDEVKFYLTKNVPHDILLKLRFLRVLSLSHYCNIVLPESIGDFKHLRYLDVSFTGIGRLPKSTCMLLNLQTLNLSGCKFLAQLPKNMRNLINLRHLYVSGTSIKNMPIQMGRLQCLRTLTKFVVGKDIGFRIEELGKLSNLRGVIVISNLQNVIYSTNALEAKLKEKEHLKELTLEWDAANDIISRSERDVLNNLQPHTSLTKLVINNYNDTSFPNWIGDGSFSRITVVHLNSCRNCCSLPSLGQLPSLQDLFVFGFDEVVTVDADFYGSGSSTITPFQSLKILRFEAMSKWEKWSPYHGEGEDEGGAFPSLQELYLRKCPKLSGSLPKHLPSLTKLEIDGCEQLESSLPTAPSIRELLLWDCNDALLKELPPALHYLAVIGFKNLESLPLPEGVMDHNHCVESLFIYDFPVLKSLPRGGLSSPTTLKCLRICNCKEVEFPMYPCYSSLEKLEIDNSCSSLMAFPLDIFPMLRYLNIKRCSNMQSLSVPEGHHLTDLLQLKIRNCPNFVAFPSGGLSAPNLSTLRVRNCSRLNSLPENMHTFLPSLQNLWIDNCPQIESFPEGGLPSNLISLAISDCKKLICNRMEWGLQRLQSLKTLVFINADFYCWDVESFPEEYILPTTVTGLFIGGFGNLRTLDNKGFQHLTSLQYLHIQYCPKLKHMPEEGLPVSVTHTRIEGCPLLTKRLHRKKGKEWRNIARTPFIEIIERNTLNKANQLFIDGESRRTLVSQSSLPSQTPNTDDAHVLTDQDGPEIMEVSEISQLMELPTSLEALEDIPEGMMDNKPSLQRSPTFSQSSLPSQTPNTDDAPHVLTDQDGPEIMEVSEISQLMELPTSLEALEDIPEGMMDNKPSLQRSPTFSQSSLPSQTPNTDDAPHVLTDQDGLEDLLSFEIMEVSEISQLMELPTGLHGLKIEGCDALEDIPEGMMDNKPSLQHLYIIDCYSLKSFPGKNPTIALEVLYIQNCKRLDFLPPASKTNQYALLQHLCLGSSCDPLISLPLGLFPKLRSLSIWDCANLESLTMPEGIQKDLTSLETLEIRDCPKLVSFPEGGLPSPNLTSIWFSNCKSLKELPNQLHTLISLKSMFVNNCPELVSLSEGGLPSNLCLLSITFCDKIMLRMEWGLHRLDRLSQLEIEGGCKNVESFPEEKLLPSNLDSLCISRFSNLKYLDYKGLQHLTALNSLEISSCDELQSLPEEGLPSSLSLLCIRECSLLKSKLLNNKGKERFKLAHISCVEIDEEVIKDWSEIADVSCKETDEDVNLLEEP